jgi:hypothetical protein
MKKFKVRYLKDTWKKNYPNLNYIEQEVTVQAFFLGFNGASYHFLIDKKPLSLNMNDIIEMKFLGVIQNEN